jgi:hypothetical protein
MELVPDEIVLEICVFIRQDCNKIFLLSTCTTYHQLKSKIRFTTLMRTNKIINLFYYDSFINIATNSIENLPSYVTHIRFESRFIGSVKGIPTTVKSLHFRNPANEKYREDITSTVNCVTFKLTHYQQFLTEQRPIIMSKNLGF